MIISREEAQDQIQIYTDEIVKEDPGDLEEEMKSSCNGLSYDGNDGYYCKDNGNIIEYCSYYCPNTINSCRIKCEYYDGKEDDCRSLSHCGWDPIGRSGRGWCKENCGGGVTCGDGNLDSGEECDDGNTNSDDGCEWDCKKPNVEGKTCRLNIGCGGGFTCNQDPITQKYVCFGI